MVPCSVAYARHLENHYTSIWGPLRKRERPEHDSARELPADFGVLLFGRSNESLAYATVCMSQPSDEHRVELHVLTHNDEHVSSDVVELLTIVSHLHRTAQQLDLGHTVSFGRPFTDGSACTHGLISLPYLDGPKIEQVPEAMVRCLWLLPITRSELAYKEEHGVDALEQRFEDRPFDYLDPRRASVV